MRLLVVRDANGELERVEHLQLGTRLGEGLGDGGALAPEAVARTLDAVERFAERARTYDASISCIATSAVRRASDASAFGARIAAVAGAPLRVLDGATEADASFRGATYGVAHDGRRIAVVDVGGGSTECAAGRDGVLEAARSIEIGSVRVAERFADLTGAAPGAAARAAAARARTEVAAAVAPFAALAPVDAVRCVAGTPMTLAAVLAGTDVDSVGGTSLTLAAIDATIDRLLDLGLAERRALPGMLPQRADILPAGGIVLSETLRALGAGEARLEHDDLLLGFVLQSREALRDME